MPSDDELREQLRKQAEEIIEAILAGRKPAGQNSLQDIERLAIGAGQGFEERVLEYLAQEESQAQTEPVCEECGRPMRSRGKRRRQLVSQAGEIELERGYYVCPECGKRSFPLDERWGLTESVYSPEMARQMVWLSGLLTYEQCSQAFERLAHRLVPRVSIWRQTRDYGARLEVYQQQAQGHVSLERVVLPSLRQSASQRQGISLDGGMVNIRGEGWKEFKVGTIFKVKQRWERDSNTRELVQVPHGVGMVYTAVLGSASEFAPALWRLAVEQHIPQADDTSVTADGAEWIWNLVMDLFPDSLQIVDWFHACQPLALAASALFPDDPDRAKRWKERACDDLFHGAATCIAHELEQAALPEYARYFRTHQRRMQYQEFREEGYPIGSGTVESGVKQFKSRLTGAGMRWSRPAAQHMLSIRAAVLDSAFDAYWDAICIPLN